MPVKVQTVSSLGFRTLGPWYEEGRDRSSETEFADSLDGGIS